MCSCTVDAGIALDRRRLCSPSKPRTSAIMSTMLVASKPSQVGSTLARSTPASGTFAPSGHARAPIRLTSPACTPGLVQDAHGAIGQSAEQQAGSQPAQQTGLAGV